MRAYKEEAARLRARLTQKEERLDERKEKLIKQAQEVLCIGIFKAGKQTEKRSDSE